MLPKMPFDLWLEICGELAALRTKAEGLPPSDDSIHLADIQRFLEAGNVTAAWDRLAAVSQDFAHDPRLAAEVTTLLSVLRLYDGVERAVSG